MSSVSEREALARKASTFAPGGEWIAREAGEIHRQVLRESSRIQSPNFDYIHPDDLELLFKAYDGRFFGGFCRRALKGHTLHFRLSPRLTKSSGVTKRARRADGSLQLEIAIGSSVLFEGFRNGDRAVTVCGIECGSRLEALQRVFEHELIHLIEFLCWDKSNCSAKRFQEIAARLFGHASHTHNLITRRERAADAGIRVGSRVTFELDGRRVSGLVNRITKRATVLVESSGGRRYSDGKRYDAYYVPLRLLSPKERGEA